MSPRDGAARRKAWAARLCCRLRLGLLSRVGQGMGPGEGPRRSRWAGSQQVWARAGPQSSFARSHGR
eukprot:8457680-Alexandrium_andersonii.AAC.1